MDGIPQVEEEKPQKNKYSYQQALGFLSSLPDQVDFVHQFNYHTSCFEWQEESILTIPVIGTLKLGNLERCEKNQCDCRPCGCSNYNFTHCQNCCKLFVCNCLWCSQCICNRPEQINLFRGSQYKLKNENVLFEYYGRFAKLFIKDTLILEFEECNQNLSDIQCGSCKSGYPQIKVYNPLYQDTYSYTLYIEPYANKCPERPFGIYPCFQIFCSWCGCCEERRNLKVTGVNGRCIITTTRNRRNACFLHSGCWNGFMGSSCLDECHFVNYPNIYIHFENIRLVDKLAIIFSTIHHSISNRWRYSGYRGEHNTNNIEFKYYIF